MAPPTVVALRPPDLATLAVIAAAPWPRPVDFVYDDAHGRLALAAVADDPGGHPALAAHLVAAAATTRLAGGRFGRRADGALATSEWSGRLGGGWDDAVRAAFVATMAAAGVPVVHRAWHAAQTADEVG